MEKLTPEYKLSDGRVLETSPLLDNLVFPNEFYSKDFKEKHTNQEEILDEIFSRWLLDEKEYHFTLTEEETENVPTHIETEMKSIFSELITYIETNYLGLPKSLDFSFKLPNGTYLDPNKFAASIEFFRNHMFYHSYGDKEIVIDKIFAFILKNSHEIALEPKDLKTERYCIHCGNEDIDLITTFRFCFSDLHGKRKDLNYVKNEFKPLIEDSYIKHCNQREDWIDFVGIDSAKEIGDFLVLDCCEKCSHWSLDDEEFDEYIDDNFDDENEVSNHDIEPKETILYIADGVDGLNQVDDSDDDGEDEWDFEDYDDDNEFEFENKLDNDNVEEIYICNQRIFSAKSREHLPLPFAEYKENYIKVFPYEVFVWESEEKGMFCEIEKNIEIFGIKAKKVKLASLNDMDERRVFFPSYFKTKEGSFLKNERWELWEIPVEGCLYFPPVKVISIKESSKNKEVYYNNIIGDTKVLRWIVNFEIENIEFKTGIEYLPKMDIWRIYSSPIKVTEGICPYCKEHCSSLTAKKSKSFCTSLKHKYLHETISKEISINNIFKEYANETLNSMNEKEKHSVEVDNISINKYEYIEYNYESKWEFAISYEVFIDGKKYKKKSRSSFTKDGWKINVMGDLDKKVKEEIQKQLVSSKILIEFVDEIVEEKERNAERPQIKILRIRKPNNEISDGVEIEFAIDFELIYQTESIICTYERYKYSNLSYIKSRDYISAKNYETIRRPFLKFDEYVYEQLKNNEIVINTLGHI